MSVKVTIPELGWDRPDLVEIGQKWGEVYEIKPALLFYDGFKDVSYYISMLNLWDPTLPKGSIYWVLGSSYVPPRVLKVDAVTIATVFGPTCGVITYQIIDPKPYLALIAAYTMYDMYFTISAFMATRALSPALAWI